MELLSMHDPVTTEAERIQRILDIKYAPADLNKIVQECTHLTDTEKAKLGKVLTKYQDLFDGSLGTWKTDPIELELRPDAKPYHANLTQFLTLKKRNSKLKFTECVLLGYSAKSIGRNGHSQLSLSRKRMVL